MVGHERSIRGDIVAEPTSTAMCSACLSTQQPWEPTYPLAEYKSDRAAFPDDIHEIPMDWVRSPGGRRTRAEDALCDVLMDLVKPWWEDSQGKAEVVTVDGTIEEAIRALGPHRVRMADVTPGQAMEAMAWAGASGGGHGRRQGHTDGASWRMVGAARSPRL